MTTSRASLWTVAPEDRPRERLERLGPGGLSDSELVALVLGSGMPGVNVLDSARSLLAQAGGVTELMTMTVGELRALMGVGVATAGRVVAVAELWRRANDPPPGAVLAHPVDVVTAVRTFAAARSPGSGAGACATVFVIVADSELRLRVVVPLAGTDTRALVAGALHEVLYRGGTAFALALADGLSTNVGPRGPDDVSSGALDLDAGAKGAVPGAQSEGSVVDETQLRAVRDVLKLAASTVGLRYLSSVRVTADGWSPLD
ncbi:UPF0758 domain-containing protein [Subtercola boreus]|uniref:UPF0758 domain-containing protein n=1 Tax=Subtercola boreus TaxID=120213 RepID=A0A3E0WEH5_9MICO|nr:UPF0758 domain-containing protein [Subtercola boreus]RFA23639.1 hypothetical protein B7R24_01835 [Subtercola boreus]RFA24033.1 hypothetical protein B7R23_01835 [Subtercola boreus]RFA29732.1 hypothetical protein B7R25_01830 [Subtercola boreus]